MAAFNGAEDVAVALLAAGANAHLTTDWDYTPLHIAAMRGKMRVAAALVRAAMQEDARNGGGGGGVRLAALWTARSKSGDTAEDAARRLADGVDLRKELELLLGADALPLPPPPQQQQQGGAAGASGEQRAAREEEPSAKRLRSAP
jgi:hypothetical protein